ncbi:Protein of unknown function [Cotesia congregata]|uniref:Endonuclease/exonuclease/phosphatase domain-containing protein n=1 Tax=Cotesia congregata TaxID=51543 RepID=A0A8J2HSJ2_COTCN|nr:Protein of unknown function [Cotesia congregata]
MQIIIRSEMSSLKNIFKELIREEINNVYGGLKNEIIEIKNSLNQFKEICHLFSNNNNDQSADISNQNNNRTSIRKNVERILITPINNQESNVTLQQITDNINVIELGVGVNSVRKNQGGKVTLEVENEADKISILNEIKRLSIVMLNICGLIYHKDELNSWINITKPDLICLTETHISEDVLDCELNIDNYNFSRTNTLNKRTGGVITYIKKSISFITLVTSDELIQGTWINVVQLKGKSQLTVCNLYRSPNSSINYFCDKFINFIENFVDTDKIIILGDFNVDISKNTHYSTKLLNECAFLGFKQKIEKPTRTTFTSDTRIDLVFTNFHLDTSVLLTPRISDHNIVILNVRKINNPNEDLVYYTRNKKKNLDYDLFLSKLDDKVNNIIYKNDLNNTFDFIEFNAAVNTILDDMMLILDEMAPKIRKVIKAKWNNKSWVTMELIDKMKVRDKAFVECKKSKESYDIAKYKKLRNNIIVELRNNKRKYYEDHIDKNRSDSRKLWMYLKEVLSRDYYDRSRSSSYSESRSRSRDSFLRGKSRDYYSCARSRDHHVRRRPRNRHSRVRSRDRFSRALDQEIVVRVLIQEKKKYENIQALAADLGVNNRLIIQENENSQTVVAAQLTQLDESILKEIGKRLDPDNATGPPIEQEIALRWTEILEKGLPKEEKLELLKKFSTPENSITSSISEEEVDKLVVLELVSDVCRVLSEVQREESLTRKALVHTNLNSSLRETLNATTIGEMLFGKELESQIKIAKTLERTSKKLKSSDKPSKQQKTASARSV